MIFLGDVSKGRDNNLNLIRMVAASAVLVSHAFPIDRGTGADEPLRRLVGHSLGTLSVYVFFLISGFLITASFRHTSGTGRFVAARALRLFPGLAVSLLAVAFLLGPVVTGLPVTTYLGDGRTWRFLAANVTMAFPQYTLPGVFVDNPYPTVEGSIWTLIHEVACYGLVLIAGLCGLLRGRRIWILIGLYALGWALSLALPQLLPPRLQTLQTLSLPFFAGMCGWMFRDRIALSFLGVALTFAIWIVARDTPVAFLALVVFLGYAVAWLAYVPRGIVRAYNRQGDYSYGVYIYAFPLQGLVVWAFGSVGPALNVILAFPPTLLAAIVSWHLVEKPALGWLKSRRRAGMDG